MEPRIVTVAKDLLIYLCRMDRTGVRCGACLRGLVKPERRAECKVCGAKVNQALFKPDPEAKGGWY